MKLRIRTREAPRPRRAEKGVPKVVGFETLRKRRRTLAVGSVVTMPDLEPGLWRVTALTNDTIFGHTLAEVINVQTGAEYNGLIHPDLFEHPNSTHLEHAPAERVTDINEWRRSRGKGGPA